jgi:hypothetical protein
MLRKGCYNMSAFQETMSRMFPVDPAHIKTCINKLRSIRDNQQAVITSQDAGTILNALVRYEATVQESTATTETEL